MKREVLIAVLENKRLDIEIKKLALKDAKAEIKRKESEAELNAVKRDVAYRDPQVFTANIKRQAEIIRHLNSDVERLLKLGREHNEIEKRFKEIVTQQQELLEYPAVKFVLYLKDKLFTIRTKPQNN